MFEKAKSRRLQFAYKQTQNGENGGNEIMTATFNTQNLLKPIINVGGSIFEGRVVATTSHTGNRKRSFLRIEFNNDRLPRGVENRSVSFDLAEFFPLTVGFLGFSFPLIKPILSSEHLRIKVNYITPVSRKPPEKNREEILSVEDTQIKILISKEKKFKAKEKKLIRALIAQLEKEKSVVKK